MTAGHFGLAAAIKPLTPKIPLWALMLATYLLDVIFIFLLGAGVEGLTETHPGYGGALISADYTHSLVGSLVIALLAGLLAKRFWGLVAESVIGAMVFSHWVLDLVVHRPDMPILPANLGGLPLLGLGLWNVPLASALIELVLVLVGAWLYFREAGRHATEAAASPGRGTVAGVVTAALLVLLLAADFFGLPVVVVLVLMLALIVVSGWLDARIGRAAA